MTALAPPAVEPARQLRRMSEHALRMPDGVELFYRAWLPLADQASGDALLLLHRGHEHSGRFADVVEAVAPAGVSVFAWDARGHGRSPGPRGYAESFAATVRDLDAFARGAARRHGLALERTAVLAHSVGAVAALAWAHDYAPPLRALVLLAPALRVKLYVPLARSGLRLLRRWSGERPRFVKSYVRAGLLTHDPAEARRYEEDPLIARSIAVNLLLDLHDTSTRLLADAAAITTPTLLLAAGSDWVVKLAPQRALFAALGSPVKRMRVFPGMYHDLLHERDRGPVLDEARRFLESAYAAPATAAAGAVDEAAYTREEHARLARPLPLLCPRRAGFAVQRASLKTLGRLSAGIRLGWRTGFDSGPSLDYVYRDAPSGATPLGRAIDRAYLGSLGWRGIRQRKAHLQELMREAMRRLRDEGRPVRVLDVACGGGRYVLETLAASPEFEATALLRDDRPANLDGARALAASLGLGLSRVRFEVGDAFDADGLARLTPAPTLAVVSGLYELFPDNAPVLASLRGIGAAMREGGYLLYTGQPWHPQLEMIARVLTNREGRPWIMRRRPQAEMDALAAAAGFRKEDMRIDRYGIFTVSLARREPEA